MDWDKVNCNQCSKCNKKGLPSVMKGSDYCERQRGILPPRQKNDVPWYGILSNFLHQRTKGKKAQDEDKEVNGE